MKKRTGNIKYSGKGIIRYGDMFLRPVAYRDLGKIVEWRNKPEIMRWFFKDTKFTLSRQKKWYRRYIKDQGNICFIICRGDGRSLGTVSIYDIDRSSEQAEFGRLLIGEDDCLGKGYAKRGSLALLDYAFTRLGLKEVYLEVFGDNLRAKRLYRCCGFRRVRSRSRKVLKTGRPQEVLYMRMRKEWFPSY